MVERIPMKFVIALFFVTTYGLVSLFMPEPTDFLFFFGLLLLIGATFARIFPPRDIEKDKRRLALFSLSASAMLVWPLSLFYGIRGFLGLKSIYKAQMWDYPLLPRLWFEAVLWLGLGIALPFLAAWLLSLARKKREMVELQFSVRGYLVCLGISILGSVYLAPFALVVILVASTLKSIGGFR